MQIFLDENGEPQNDFPHCLFMIGEWLMETTELMAQFIALYQVREGIAFSLVRGYKSRGGNGRFRFLQNEIFEFLWKNQLIFLFLKKLIQF